MYRFFDKKLNLDISVSLIENSINDIFDDFSHFLIYLQELRTGGVYSLYLIIFAIFNVCIHSSKDLGSIKQHLKTFPNLLTPLSSSSSSLSSKKSHELLINFI